MVGPSGSSVLSCMDIVDYLNYIIDFELNKLIITIEVIQNSIEKCYQAPATCDQHMVYS